MTLKELEYIDWKFVLTWTIAITAFYLFWTFIPSLSELFYILDKKTQLTTSLGSMTGIKLSIVLGSIFRGAVLGFIQWLLLRKRLDHAGWWIVILAFDGVLNGLQLVLLFIPAVIFPPEIELSLFAYTTVVVSIVLLTGVLQLLILNHQTYKSWVWIIAALVAYGLDVILSFIPIFLVQGLIAVVTGAVMSWMLNHPFDDDEPEFAIEEEG